MINHVAIGAQGGNKELKTFSELYETSVWRLIMKHIDEEKRADGEVAYVVKDLGNLVVAIIEFYEKKRIKN